ncbi:carbohydrate ABC transporter permease [Paenibacillus alginolyticus]|uniref:Carbohydrate ABC transporter permease n=1 Tax=Paenibacillus alginolyticus TaxID=59839 RepID=A0ABT4GAG3_9BACL|nr:carbohydrate ABC transporter permease [Paenibacillus alginolyticus]MCY9693163.1 carbohydrate ABC transporter permease [Paenibacillus alginolyticus]MEC0144542.1 carbohydrate ABC transporter permease [Paenibacillus alginolyticus]
MKTNHMNQPAVHLLMLVLTAACLFPFLLLFMASFTDEKAIVAHGYSIWPSTFSVDAYQYLFSNSATIVRSYGITVLITAVGTVSGLLISSLLAYPLSRNDMPLRGTISFIVFFTLLFNGGLVSTYLVYTEVLHLKNTLLALIIPGLLTNGFFILLIRTFFSTSIPAAVIESAYMDGASEYKIFYRIVLPLSLPILATIGLMLTIAYWNDWFNGLVYVTDPKLFSIQNLLNRMLSNVQFLQQNDLGGNAQKAVANVPMNSVRMAMAVIGILPIICMYPFFQKYFVKGLTIGAVKG